MSKTKLEPGRLGEFRKWLLTRGWKDDHILEDAREVLRMRHPKEREPLLVHDHNNGGMTLYGHAKHEFISWTRSSLKIKASAKTEFDPSKV